MAQALQIDTLAFSKKLREAGADEGLAEAIVEGLSAADTSNLATKADIAEVKAEIAEVKTDLSWIKIIGGAIVALLILPWLAELAKVALS